MHRGIGVCANGNFPFPCPGRAEMGRDVFHSESHLHAECEHKQGSELRVSSWTSSCPAGRMSSGADFPESLVICSLPAVCLYCANLEILLCRLPQPAQLQAKKITGRNKQPKLSRDTGRCTKPRWDSPIRTSPSEPCSCFSIYPHTLRDYVVWVWQGLGCVFSVSFNDWENLAKLY